MKQALTWTGESRRFGPGVGFNWFDYLGMGGHYAHPPGFYPLDDPCLPDPGDTGAWALLLDELDRLRPGFLRFGIPPDPHIGESGGLVKDSAHLRRLDHVAGWAARNGCTILLDTFLIPSRHEMQPPAGGVPSQSMYQFAAANNRAYAREFVAPFLAHIVNERGLEAVRFFNPVNEPMCYGVYQTPDNEPDVYAHYVDMYREMRAALDEAGLPRERLGLVGADSVEADNFPALEMLARGVDLDPYVDAYSLHYYFLRFDHLPPRPEIVPTTPMSEGMDKQTGKIARYCRRRGKPLWAAEIGSFYYGWRAGDPAGPSTFDATLTVAEGVIRGMNAGLDAFAFWSLLNPNTIDGHWAILKMEDGRPVAAPHPHRVYGALTRACRPGSDVFPLRTTAAPGDLAYVHGTALLTPENERVVLLINDHPSAAVEVALELPWIWTSARGSVVEREVAGGGEIACSGRAATLEIPPFSLVSLKVMDGWGGMRAPSQA